LNGHNETYAESYMQPKEKNENDPTKSREEEKLTFEGKLW
jgi:hypothetical protein